MTIVIVGFNTKMEQSTFYRKYKTIKGALRTLEKIFLDDKTEFVSIRIIDKDLLYKNRNNTLISQLDYDLHPKDQ